MGELPESAFKQATLSGSLHLPSLALQAQAAVEMTGWEGKETAEEGEGRSCPWSRLLPRTKPTGAVLPGTCPRSRKARFGAVPGYSRSSRRRAGLILPPAANKVPPVRVNLQRSR